MNYDSFVTAAIAHEAQGLVGAFVDHIAQPSEREVFLTFYTDRRKRRWVFSVDARLARVHQVEEKPENPAMPPNFCMLLRKWIDGARLAAVRQVGFDRVLRWEFTRSDGRRALISEVMGKHSNLILVDEDEVILGAVKRVPAAMSRARQILPGLPYSPPPGDRLDPLTANRAALMEVVSSQWPVVSGSGNPAVRAALAKLLVASLAGFGPFAAAEVLARAGSTDLDAAWQAVSDLAAATREGRFQPSLFYRTTPPEPSNQNPTPIPSGFWAFASVQVPAAEQRRAVSMSAAADAFSGATQRAGTEASLRGELLSGARKERERLERLAKRLEDDLRRGDEVGRWKIAGELLAANQWQVERGQTAVEVANYYDPEQRPLKIELDAELTPQENVERLFRRYRKGTDAALQAMEQSEKVAARLAEAREWEDRVAAAPLEELPRLRAALAESGLLAARRATGGGKSTSRDDRGASEFPPGVRIRRYMVEGWEVLLGENATSNDYLTTRVARSDDWWLHVRASPSAHVVIRTGGRPDRVPPAVLHEAARLTAAHSESKHSSYVPVDYVLKKYVRKPRGSGPGLVTHRGEKTLYVEPGR